MARSGLAVGAASLCALALAACSAPTNSSGSSAQDGLVLADGYELGGYNPIAGYGAAGEAKMYDGLLKLDGTDGLPGFEPSLATELPTANADATVWTVPLREGVTFSDGSTFDAADVVATYDAILNPASASEARSSFDMITEVTALDPRTVEFRLAYPYSAMPTKMLIGIVPSESVATEGLAAESSLNTAPIGTGPYTLVDLSPDRAVFEANEDYFGGAPEVKKLTLLYVPDDNTRAQRMAAGEIDGTNLPPLLAETLDGRDGMSLTANTSADWRGVSLPTDNPVAGDKAMRMALNLAANRQSMVDNILGGHGRPAATPIPEVYGAAYEPSAAFPYDPAEAERLLTAAGWVVGPDGIRVRDGVRAEFSVMYNASDTVRRDLAQAFASDALAVGVEVNLEALSWDRIDPRISYDATLLGGGSEPYDPDTQAYNALDSEFVEPGVGSIYDNASDYSNPAVDAALEAGRRSLDPAERDAAYRDMQRAYVDDPGYVYLVFLDHTYVSKDSDWTKSGPILEPHAHGVTWGPWWSLQTWTRQS
ncbi:ABC transporter substrate-binding protein [Rhodococcus sp. BP-252]|uniref:ABC transporter substrate-binding protein n=1 Tax=unclassified Rhodococcus (in: high G+C Gram-positive bacteria) TaxID=192944 RepID=UPI00143023BD|nr:MULTISPECIES: ABC transporter substrate-binding protein [unclassified Rhodococcus (in: high G+C Gram-positive bacteria)]MBY6410444.1 ABC transporter substrate-binding protein [Rhodococcus sp. BP-320]MBY6416326.1 ABC transporter substrate-binding protein [Rhodococcus sp. BP-321]MBY6420321.1 ABC transporter substrate-binding protein [Rhodococcus sp. BP-324]MBY6425000.1 ABC transporter substrate-binding protein [Rhodococcus sp. BP-323]MBY6430294.1 ABC transporter substrate-binding protein [Rho